MNIHHVCSKLCENWILYLMKWKLYVKNCILYLINWMLHLMNFVSIILFDFSHFMSYDWRTNILVNLLWSRWSSLYILTYIQLDEHVSLPLNTPKYFLLSKHSIPTLPPCIIFSTYPFCLGEIVVNVVFNVISVSSTVVKNTRMYTSTSQMLRQFSD